VIQADPQQNNYDSIYMPDGVTPNEAAFKKLDRIVTLASAHHIAIDLCLFTFPGVTNRGIWRDYRYWDQLEKLWVFMATRYKKFPNVVAYELMNEPRLVLDEGGGIDRVGLRTGSWDFPDNWKNSPKDYFALVERVGQAINRIDASKAVIVPAVGSWGSPLNFNWMRPVNVRNVVYTFHMYIPHAFGDSGKQGRSIVGYDSKKTRSKVIEAMEPARRFAEKYNARIFVGELGLPVHTEGMGARDWLHDVLGYVEKNGWTWAYWTYHIPFRNPEMVKGANGVLEMHEDTERLTALKEYWQLNSVDFAKSVKTRN
jgi:aryl-phospho-beta-D-glucosidase BglC (GH1 family)